MNIFLIGYRGTGKTTVARIVGERIAWPSIDADNEIEKRAGKTIAAIFDAEGEQGFRNRESDVVEELAAGDRRVVSLGGGAVLREQNRQAIAGSGAVVWLQANAETIARRIGGDQTTASSRPNLTAEGGLREIRDLLQHRTPIYQQCCQFTVDTEGKTPEAVADEMIDLLGLTRK